MTPLFVFLNRQLAIPFAWGGHGGTDCMLMLADWVMFLRGVDPAADVRFCYDSPASCHRLMGWFRDPIAAIGDRFERVGIMRTNEAVRGDVALVRVDGQAVGAICTGKAWAMKADGRGVHTREAAEVLAVWSVGYAG
jgi:hypothetical protein